MDELTNTESNALKWVLLKDYWLTHNSRGTEIENYVALESFLRTLGVEKVERGGNCEDHREQ